MRFQVGERYIDVDQEKHEAAWNAPSDKFQQRLTYLWQRGEGVVYWKPYLDQHISLPTNNCLNSITNKSCNTNHYGNHT
jgi:hypothetical protein